MVLLSVRTLLLGAIGVLVAGVALIALSVAEGDASVWLFLIVPVVSGSSFTFLLGVALLIVGFLSIPFALAEEWSEARPPHPASGASSSEGNGTAGGFVLIGPVPIVFGSWKGVSRRTRWWLALAGAVLLSVALVAFVWLLR